MKFYLSFLAAFAVIAITFQNCGSGFSSLSQDGGSVDFSSNNPGNFSDGSPNLVGESCEGKTTLVNCDGATLLPQSFYADGCPVVACREETSSNPTNGGNPGAGGDQCPPLESTEIPV
ncbi:MAG: hypothetical protein HRT44_08990, partial [Bdellovibrionales bacterium]|nr:hypothetical protein [Bdellovibrionales bacterium]NQZ19376.1 hypothetical protein [Bdellovibrionales bacterium]